MFVIKEEFDQNYTDFLFKKGQVLDQDPLEIQLFRLRIRPVQKVPDPQHWLQIIRILVFGEFGSSLTVLMAKK